MKGGSIDRLPEVTGERGYRELAHRDEWQLHHQGGAYARDIKAAEAATGIVTENQACCRNLHFNMQNRCVKRTVPMTL